MIEDANHLPPAASAPILTPRLTFRPFAFPWAYDAFMRHEASHWLHTEPSMTDDVRDFDARLSPQEREFLTKVLRFFVQGDLDIGEGYYKHFLPAFPVPEVRMMMSSFAAREALHAAAYAHLIETLPLSGKDHIYNEFLDYAAMREKHEFVQDLDGMSLGEKLAIISAFGEGMQLFSSFVMLLNFPRNGTLKGLGSIITWSIRDETQHAEGMIRVYREVVRTCPDPPSEARIHEIAAKMVALEDRFIDLAFGIVGAAGPGVSSSGEGGGEGPKDLTAEQVRAYIRFIADRRLEQMGHAPLFGIKRNPLPWVDGMTGVEHTNFFEARPTEYGKGAMRGSWSDVWGAAATKGGEEEAGASSPERSEIDDLRERNAFLEESLHLAEESVLSLQEDLQRARDQG